MAAVNDPYAQVEDDDYIKVAADEGDEFMEIPKEDDGTIMLSTIQTQFPDAIGLKCKGSSGAWRAIRAMDNILAAPKGGWGEKIYFVTFSETRKRKSDAITNADESKRPISNPYLKDMAVIGLPYGTTTEELKEYFEKNYGETAYCEVKYERLTGKSRGFGFVRFKDGDCAKVAADTEHYMEGRKVIVKVKQEKPMKMFIGRLPHGITNEDLRDYFSKFGELQDVYIPQPFRNFAFITYASSEDGQHVLRGTHVLQGARLNVEERKPDSRTAGRDNRDKDQGMDRGRGMNSSISGYMTKDYQQSKYGEQRSDLTGDLKSMLFEFLTKSK